jgi:lipopolysaccharide exporter
LYTLLHRFSIIFFGVVTYFILVRHISPEENGVWSLFLLIVSITEMIKQGLLRNPMIKFLSVAEYADQKDEVQSTALFINIGFSVLAVAVFVFLGGWIAGFLKAPNLHGLLIWNTLFILLLIPFNHCEVVLQANFKYPQIFYAYFLRQGLFMIMVVLLVYVFPQYLNLLTLAILQIIALFMGTVLILIACRPLLPKHFKTSRKLMRAMFHFGKYVFGTNFFNNLSKSADHFITAAAIPNEVLGKRYVSYYNAVSRINNLVDVPSVAVSDVLFPKNVQAIEMEGMTKVKYYFERMVATLISFILPLSIVVILFPKLVMLIIAGQQYVQAADILQVMMLVAVIRPFFYQFGTTMDAIGKPQLNFLMNMVLMVINLSFTYAGLKIFGRPGAAYASVGYHILGLLLIYGVLKRQVKIEMRNILSYVVGNYSQVFSIARKYLSGDHKLKVENPKVDAES